MADTTTTDLASWLRQQIIDRSDGSGRIAVLDADDLVAWLNDLPDTVTPREIADSINLYALELAMRSPS